jgi:dihydrofolate reductase
VGKAGAGKDIAILGSGSLVRQLTDHGLIDEYRLTLNPVILGAGQGLFAGLVPPVSKPPREEIRLGGLLLAAAV